jgi:hypothetical protein
MPTSYTEQWLEAVRTKQASKPVEPAPVTPPAWKPWAEMTSEERRKALSERQDATPRPSGR